MTDINPEARAAVQPPAPDRLAEIRALMDAEIEWNRYWIEEGGDPYHHRDHFIAGYLAAVRDWQARVERAEDALETIHIQATGIGYEVAHKYFAGKGRASVSAPPPDAVAERTLWLMRHLCDALGWDVPTSADHSLWDHAVAEVRRLRESAVSAPPPDPLPYAECDVCEEEGPLFRWYAQNGDVMSLCEDCHGKSFAWLWDHFREESPAVSAPPVAAMRDGTPGNRCHGCWTAGKTSLAFLIPQSEMYRCFYCDRYWCRACAAEHFPTHASVSAPPRPAGDSALTPEHWHDERGDRAIYEEFGAQSEGDFDLVRRAYFVGAQRAEGVTVTASDTSIQVGREMASHLLLCLEEIVGSTAIDYDLRQIIRALRSVGVRTLPAAESPAPPATVEEK